MSKPFSEILAISPIDGRYREKVKELANYFSEFALIRFRLFIEIKWLEALSACKDIREIKVFSEDAKVYLNQLVEGFSVENAESVKQIEKTTNHDVKSVEYFLKEYIKKHTELSNYMEFIHFACTSEDINNLSYSLMMDGANKEILSKEINNIIKMLDVLSKQNSNVSMLARTHGQPATPTTVGKEMANVKARLCRQYENINSFKFSGKANGATGNYSAHCVAYPDLDWIAFSRNFIESLGLEFNPMTTQIEPHDVIAEYSHILFRINTILIDYCRDMWLYISMNYFTQKQKENEVGSSTMPHKINPIDFENAEGNLGVANALLNHFAEKLPISRLQRDLSDSTVLRNLGSAFAYSLLAYKSLQKGISKIFVNKSLIESDLKNHWEVLAEPIQTVMRKCRVENAYEKLKSFSRGKAVTKEDVLLFIDSLGLPNEEKDKLKSLTPENYIGLARQLAEK